MSNASTGAASAVEADDPLDTTTEDTAPDLALATDDVVDLGAATEPELEDTETAEASEDDEAVDGVEEEGEGDEEADIREFNFGGNKFEYDVSQMPEELAEKTQAFIAGTWADYTAKQQANAEQAKSLTAQAESVAKLTTLNGEALQTYSSGLQIQSELEQLSKIERPSQAYMDQLSQTNADEWRRVSDRLAGLDRTIGEKQAEFQAIVARVGQQEHELDAAQQAELARRSDEGKAVLDRRFKNFSTEKAPEVVQYVVGQGMDEADAAQWALNPRVTEMAYKAMLYDRMQANIGKPKAKRKAVNPVRPMRSKGTAGTASTDPDKMSFKELGKVLGIPT